MPSIKSSVTFVATAILAIGAQAQLTYEIDPNSVPLGTRENWCTSQKASCPLLCLQLQGASSSTIANTCDPTTLDYQCTCGNGQAPSAANYSQTIPYFECTTYGDQCVAACGAHDSACQTACRVDNPCGAQSPSLVNSTTTTSSSPSTSASSADSTDTSASTTGAGSSSGSGASSPTETGSKSTSSQGSAMSTLDGARGYSFALVFSGLFAAFALAM
ncbi:hypothetical protein OIDMADRAFT_128864 [Oidiodendron maius Zn]|uniref:DUF7707 domain-containing protein n=1 Tax=Oidiodendron maius (strain Zn) TaxID=913774 RepID=A0A0C3H658_OIDMZ|nr:hypothetical protein OIDMADRAFT_128864 [Oidiodendron maius Zn]